MQGQEIGERNWGAMRPQRPTIWEVSGDIWRSWDTSEGIWGDLEASGWSWLKKCHTSQLKSKNPKNTSISRGVFEGHIDFDRIFTAT